tara:strand:- start:8826 stop:9578 length:753 start_codon:yes stop_codon:yes gene_type:complete
MKSIAICLIGTNAYFTLAIRFINRFFHFYTGDNLYRFYLFTDRDPKPFLPEYTDYVWVKAAHDNWADATNSKFTSMLSIPEHDYIYYFDADTNVNRKFGDWFIGDLVGGQHFMYQNAGFHYMPLEKNEESNCFLPYEEGKKYSYYLGAFFGGRYDLVKKMCIELKARQDLDHSLGYEAPVNDESYINYYFNKFEVKIISTKEFQFEISHKGGLKIFRDPNVKFIEIEELIRKNKDSIFNILNGKYIEEQI